MKTPDATTAGTPADAPAPRRWWVAATLALCALLSVGQIVSIVLLIGHDQAARRAVPAVAPSVRALELENRELRSEVTRLKIEMEKRLYAAAARETAARETSVASAPKAAERAAPTPASTTLPDAVAPPAQWTAPLGEARPRSALLSKSFIIHAGR